MSLLLALVILALGVFLAWLVFGDGDDEIRDDGRVETSLFSYRKGRRP